ncbi:MAG: PKD domain-containing protein [Bacteroidetes bacterium]|nr:MAG: PKD domain-containing protein [Bacteroidota bacterium]
MKHIYLFGLLLSLPFIGFSQGEWNNWIFGKHAGITFNSGTPIPIPNVSPLFFSPNSTLTISDSLGNLLFYADNNSNAERVFNRNNVQMPNGNLLYACLSGTPQPFFAVQSLTDDSVYYLFTVVNPTPVTNPGGLFYSIIDMRLDGGFGDILPGQKSIPIFSGYHTRCVLTATRHQNNKDVWLIVRKHNDNYNYLSYLINSSGIDTIPIQSTSLFSIDSTVINGEINTIKVSPDGTKLVCLSDTNAEYGSFNSTTGAITSLFKIRVNSHQNFGECDAEFSIDNKYLYIDAFNIANTTSYLYQFDATKTDSIGFKQSQILIYSEPQLWNQQFAGLQRGPDQKIYCIAMSNIDSISVIEKPHLQGSSCDFQKNAYCLLPPNWAVYGFPQFLQKYYVYIHHSNILCTNDSVNFTSSIWPPADSIHWDFGDPASGMANYSLIPNPSHFYSIPGSYTVTLFVKHIDHRTDTAWQTINILANPHVNLGANRTICIGDSTTFDAGACSGCTYLWKDIGSGLTVGTSQTFKTGLAGIYEVTVTNSDGCSGADTVQLITTVVPLVTNNPLSKSICSGESTNILLTSNVPGTNFHWTASLTSGNITGFSADSGLVIIQVLTNSLPTPGVVTYHITPKVGSCVGTPVDFDVTVTPGDSVKVSISVSTNNICAGTLVMFTANPTNPGTSPVYHWKVNGINAGTNSTTFSYTPINSDLVTCELLSSLTVCISNNPATSNSITMFVNPNLPVSVTVTPSQNPICSGTTVNFTAYPVNEGTSPTYQWKVNGTAVGANLSTYSYIPLNGDMVTCTVNSNATCAVNNPSTSPPVTMTVNPNMPVSVSITSSSNPFCTGSSVTFTATPANGGTVPAYQWKVNGIGVGPDNQVYSYFPNNGDVVTCVLNSNIACPISNPATSNSITMVVNTGLPAGINISASTNPFCPGSSVTFTATPVNGGSTPAYQWKVNGNNVGINSSTYTYNPVNNDSVRCVMTSNLSCVTGNPASSSKIIMSGTLAPSVSFTSCFDTITTVNAKPIKLKGGIPLGGTYSGPGVNSLTGVFTPAVAGVGTHTITYTYTNAALCSALAHTHIINYPLSIVNCGSPITDIRDNKIYQTVQIGSQCWLASNLNYGTILASAQDQRDNCISEKYCYNDNPINCTNQGGLYQWDELMLFDETPANQGFCPPGWHIPTENDWNILFATFINNGFAGSPLKYSGYSGFNALLSGARHINKGWDFQGFATFFWSSTLRSDNKAWAHGMNDPDPSVSIYPASRVNAFSVRCLKD